MQLCEKGNQMRDNICGRRIKSREYGIARARKRREKSKHKGKKAKGTKQEANVTTNQIYTLMAMHFDKEMQKST